MQDETVFDDMVAQLDATRKFNLVKWGDYDGTWPTSGATAHIRRYQFTIDERVGQLDDNDRRVDYRITLLYFNVNDNTRRRRILNFEAIIHNLFHMKKLGGLTMPHATRITRGRDEQRAPGGVSQVIIEGYFTYRIAVRNGLLVEGF